MHAYVAATDSPPGLAYREVDEPAPARSSQALVEVRATSLNRGELVRLHEQPEGTVLGWDLAGVVLEPAADASGPSAGTRVFGWTANRGSWAQRVAVETKTISAMPADLGFGPASAIGVAGITALYALRRGGSLLGRLVIVTGAAGGVGRMAVQLAARSGARVLAIVGPSSERIAAITSLDLPGVKIAHRLEPRGERAHLILESVGGESLSAAFRRVAHGGCIVTYGRSAAEPGSVPPEWFYRDARLEGVQFSLDQAREQTSPSALEILAELVVSGQLDAGIGWESSWTQLPAAAQALLDRKIPGRAVLHVSTDRAGVPSQKGT